MISAVVGILYYTFTDDYLLTFMLNSNEESLHDLYEWWCICVQHSADFNHQFVSLVTSKPTASP